MQRILTTCDSCGVEQDDLSGCYIITSDSTHFQMFPALDVSTKKLKDATDGRIVIHVCGASCATKIMAAWLGAHQEGRKVNEEGQAA